MRHSASHYSLITTSYPDSVRTVYPKRHGLLCTVNGIEIWTDNGVADMARYNDRIVYPKP